LTRGAAPRSRHATAQIRLPQLRRRCGPGSSPERLIRAGLPTEALVAHVLVSKYAWHLPLYRQAQIPLAQGIAIERSVLAFWVGYAAAELMPLWRHLLGGMAA
jgi:transposase